MNLYMIAEPSQRSRYIRYWKMILAGSVFMAVSFGLGYGVAKPDTRFVCLVLTLGLVILYATISYGFLKRRYLKYTTGLSRW